MPTGKSGGALKQRGEKEKNSSRHVSGASASDLGVTPLMMLDPGQRLSAEGIKLQVQMEQQALLQAAVEAAAPKASAANTPGNSKKSNAPDDKVTPLDVNYPKDPTSELARARAAAKRGEQEFNHRLRMSRLQTEARFQVYLARENEEEEAKRLACGDTPGRGRKRAAEEPPMPAEGELLDGRDAEYYRRRRKNNEAAKRSRDNRRNKERMTEIQNDFKTTELELMRIQVLELRQQLKEIKGEDALMEDGLMDPGVPLMPQRLLFPPPQQQQQEQLPSQPVPETPPAAAAAAAAAPTFPPAAGASAAVAPSPVQPGPSSRGPAENRQLLAQLTLMHNNGADVPPPPPQQHFAQMLAHFLAFQQQQQQQQQQQNKKDPGAGN